MGDIAEAFRRAKAESEAKGSQAEEPREFESRRSASVAELEAEPVPIPDTRDTDWQKRAVWVEKHGATAEAFRHLALRVRTELAARRATSILVVSCDREEGKTLTACNLALALASVSAGERIALVELDLRRPAVAQSLGVRPRVGFEDVLSGDAFLEQCWTPTEIADLDLYPVRRRVPDPHAWLSRPTLARALHQLERSYSLVVCDGPPALPLPDVEIIAPHVGTYLPVVRAGKTSRSAYAELVEMLPRAGLIGAFLNCARPSRHARRFYRDGGYGSPDGDEPEEK